MTNAFSLFRSLIIYGICLPLAIFIGYLLATPTDLTTYASVGLLFSLMTIPLFLRWHYPWLILAWNTTAGLYFMPGKPSFPLLMIFASFFISSLSYIMNRNLKFISVPSVSRPLIFIALVVFGTAKLTNSLGLNVLGSDTMGGKRYIYLLAAVLGYFALVAQRIPARKVSLYINLYFLGALSAAVGNLLSIINPSFYFIFLIFPADTGAAASAVSDTGITRLSGISSTCSAVIGLLLARYGIEGLLDPRRYWRAIAFISLFVLSLFGGFRSNVINLALLCGALFYMEGLFRTRLLPVVLLAAVLSAALIVPFSNKLPLSIQRSLTFLPLDLDKDAEANAKASTEWRLIMWRSVLPMVPQYLILGKGLGIDSHDMEMWRDGLGQAGDSSAGAAMAGDYHSGPLSLIMPFGILGVVGFVWFLVAGGRVLYRNYKYGDPSLVRINRYLWVFFLIKIIIFLFIFGSFYSDLAYFVGPVGFSIALNGGLRKPAEDPVPRQVFNKFKLANAAR